MTGTSAWGFTCPNDGSGGNFGITAINVYVTSGAFGAAANSIPYTVTLLRGNVSGGVVTPAIGTPLASISGTYPFAFSVRVSIGIFANCGNLFMSFSTVGGSR